MYSSWGICLFWRFFQVDFDYDISIGSEVNVNSETPDVVFEDVNVDILSSDLAAKKGNELIERITSVARQSVIFIEFEPLESGDHQVRLVDYPIIYKVLFIPGGAGFLLSTVVYPPGNDHISPYQSALSSR